MRWKPEIAVLLSAKPLANFSDVIYVGQLGHADNMAKFGQHARDRLGARRQVAVLAARCARVALRGDVFLRPDGR